MVPENISVLLVIVWLGGTHEPLRDPACPRWRGLTCKYTPLLRRGIAIRVCESDDEEWDDKNRGSMRIVVCYLLRGGGFVAGRQPHVLPFG